MSTIKLTYEVLMISVIVPVFNVEKYLSNCLESILNQSVRDLEIICVDDGSTDGSLNILHDFAKKDSRIKALTKPNGGLSSSRNFGLDHANGDYVCFVDSDDELFPNSIENLHNGIKKTGALASVGAIHVVYEAHKELEDSDNSYYQIRYSGLKEINDQIRFSFHYSACGCLFSMKPIRELGLRFPQGLCYEDAWWHWAYFSQIDKVFFLKDAVYRYFRRPVSIMSQTFDKTSSKAIDHLTITARLFDFWIHQKQDQDRQDTMAKLLEDYFWLSYRYSPLDRRIDVLYECLKIIREYKLNVGTSGVLYEISHGDLARFFSTNTNQTDSAYVRYLQLKTLFDKYFPPSSKKRKLAYFLAKRAYNILR